MDEAISNLKLDLTRVGQDTIDFNVLELSKQLFKRDVDKLRSVAKLNDIVDEVTEVRVVSAVIDGIRQQLQLEKLEAESWTGEKELVRNVIGSRRGEGQKIVGEDEERVKSEQEKTGKDESWDSQNCNFDKQNVSLADVRGAVERKIAFY